MPAPHRRSLPLAVTAVIALTPVAAHADSTRPIAFEHAGGISLALADGSRHPLLADDADSPNYSSDGSRIAFARRGTGHRGIWVMRADGTGLRRVTRGADDHPAFSPNGRKLVFHRRTDTTARGQVRRRAVGNGAFVIDRDGTHLRYVGRRSIGEAQYPVFAPDGRHVVYDEVAVNPGIYSVDLRGRNRHRLVSGRRGPEAPAFSPDGRTLLFTDVVGNVRAADAHGRHARTLIAAPLDTGVMYVRPVFSADGQRIAVATNADEIYTATAAGTDLQLVAEDASAPAWAAR